MELQIARQIIDTLAQGIHPVTGEVMPEDSPYNAPPVIRALFAMSQALGATASGTKAQRELPSNAGKPWHPQEDGKLESAFAAGIAIKQIAQSLHIALSTVKCHVRAILGKFDAESRTQAALRALRTQTLLPDELQTCAGAKVGRDDCKR